jgi:hypothetical protein
MRRDVGRHDSYQKYKVIPAKSYSELWKALHTHLHRAVSMLPECNRLFRFAYSAKYANRKLHGGGKCSENSMNQRQPDIPSLVCFC